jgi:4-hydroxythreonine-4-phosphate dehydrogenase
VTASLPTLVVSSGEPAGIGPELCAALGSRSWPVRLGVLGDPELIKSRARSAGIEVEVVTRASPEALEPHALGVLQVLPLVLRAPSVPGRLDTANAAYVLEMLRLGGELCLSGRAQALVTAPVQKSVITHSGVPFSGHTEFLAELCGGRQPVMMLASPQLRVALATTHLPLRAVPDALGREQLERTLRIVHADLHTKFGIATPRIIVLGLNPHAGESGTLGTEEQTLIEPVVRALAAGGLHVEGPVPADTAFTRESLERCDAVLAMYHDQGLPVIKALSFGEVVNVTLGLPIVRTSVDHGTALALAGTGRARPDSLFAAVDLACELAARVRR